MASPTTQLRDAVRGVLEAEFASEGFPVRNDKLHPSLGADGPAAAVYPEAEQSPTGTLEIQPTVVVQVYARWKPEVDPQQAVDPAAIEDWAWRFRRALRTHLTPATEQLWFANISSIDYPDDPTGNKTRFEARLTGWGPNAAVVETVA